MICILQNENVTRDELQRFLQDKGIATAIYYPLPLHLQECFEYLGYKQGDFSYAEKAALQVLSLPVYPEICMDEIEFVCGQIKKFFS